MICQNCHNTVDDDLIFCTTCGARLTETIDSLPTAAFNNSVVTQAQTPQPMPPPKRSWSLRTPLLIILCALIGAGGTLGYLLVYDTKKAVNQNVAASPSPAASTRPNKTATPAANNTNANTGSNSNAANSANNAAPNNSPTTDNSDLDQKWLDGKAPSGKSTQIWGERISVAPDSHYAVPFTVEGDDQIVGEVKTLEGPPVEGFVYLQQSFDEHFPDPTFKMFSFGGTPDTKVDQRLVKEKYTLVFVNNTKMAMVITGRFFVVKQ